MRKVPTMPMREELREELLREFEKHLEEVRSCPMTPGSLGVIMTRAAHAMARLTQESLAKAASEEADFSPSGVSALPESTAPQPEEKAKASRNGLG